MCNNKFKLIIGAVSSICLCSKIRRSFYLMSYSYSKTYLILANVPYSHVHACGAVVKSIVVVLPGSSQGSRCSILDALSWFYNVFTVILSSLVSCLCCAQSGHKKVLTDI